MCEAFLFEKIIIQVFYLNSKLAKFIYLHKYLLKRAKLNLNLQHCKISKNKEQQFMSNFHAIATDAFFFIAN